MSTTAIKLKKSSVIGKVPTTGDIDYGEVALNYADGKLYYKTSSNDIKFFLDSDNIVTSITNVVDSAYVQARQASAGNNIFSTVRVSGQSDVTADSASDVLTLVAGSNVTLVTNATNNSVTIASSAADGGTWLIKTENYTANSGDKIIADTTGGTFTITLPASPSLGDNVYIADGNNWADSAGVNLIVARNGSTIEGLDSDFTIDISTQLNFVYDNTTWQLITPFALNPPQIQTISVVDDTSTESARYITFVDQTEGDETTLNVSSSKLTFTPSTGTLTATNLNSTSDQTLKKNIQTIVDPISKVNALRGVNFNWIEDDRYSMGVIAQEVEKVIPEVITETDGVKTVNYSSIIGLLIEAIKEQQKQIDQLQNVGLK